MTTFYMVPGQTRTVKATITNSNGLPNTSKVLWTLTSQVPGDTPDNSSSSSVNSSSSTSSSASVSSSSSSEDTTPSSLSSASSSSSSADTAVVRISTFKLTTNNCLTTSGGSAASLAKQDFSDSNSVLVTALTPGTATITATATTPDVDGTLPSASFTVVVNANKPSTITFS